MARYYDYDYDNNVIIMFDAEEAMITDSTPSSISAASAPNDGNTENQDSSPLNGKASVASNGSNASNVSTVSWISSGDGVADKNHKKTPYGQIESQLFTIISKQQLQQMQQSQYYQLSQVNSGWYGPSYGAQYAYPPPQHYPPQPYPHAHPPRNRYEYRPQTHPPRAYMPHYGGDRNYEAQHNGQR
jgi:hypothetical protein